MSDIILSDHLNCWHFTHWWSRSASFSSGFWFWCYFFCSLL